MNRSPLYPGQPEKLELYDQLFLANAIKKLDLHEARRISRVLNVNWSDISDDLFLAILHIARLNLKIATQQEKDISENWLRQHCYDVPKKL